MVYLKKSQAIMEILIKAWGKFYFIFIILLFSS